MKITIKKNTEQLDFADLQLGAVFTTRGGGYFIKISKEEALKLCESKVAEFLAGHCIERYDEADQIYSIQIDQDRRVVPVEAELIIRD